MRSSTTSSTVPARRRTGTAALLAGILLVAAVGTFAISRNFSAEEARVIPPPALDTGEPQSTEVAVLAGGCFWGVRRSSSTSRASRGDLGLRGRRGRQREYESVSSGDTGHAESVRVTFDPRRSASGQLLQVFFSVAHDPTELNRQGPDEGTQYRSAIFLTTPEQAQSPRRTSRSSMRPVFDQAIVTTIAPAAFYPAEAYHQDFLTRTRAPVHRHQRRAEGRAPEAKSPSRCIGPSRCSWSARRTNRLE